MNTVLMKYIAGAGLYGLWAALVFVGKTDAQSLVYAIGAGISALLGFHAVTNLQAVQPAARAVLDSLPTIPPSREVKP